MSLLLLLAGHPVRADEVGDQANLKFEQGKRQFRLGQYDDAIALWKAAYELKGDAIFLFNIAQAYWKKNANEKAIEFYESYLKEAKDAPNRDKVLERIAELKTLVEQQKSQGQHPPTEPIAPDGSSKPQLTAPTAGPVEPGPGGGRTLKVAGLATASAGVLLVATGVYFALASSSAQSDIEAARARGDAWSPDLISRDSDGQRDALLGKLLVGVGATAIVGGGVLYVLGVRSERVTLAPYHTGLSLRVRF